MADRVCPKCGGQGKYKVGGGGHPHFPDPTSWVSCGMCGGTGRVASPDTAAPAAKSKIESTNDAKLKKLEAERAKLDKEIEALKNPAKKKHWWSK